MAFAVFGVLGRYAAALGLAGTAGEGGHDVAHHVERVVPEGDADRVGAGGQATGVGDDVAGTDPRSDVDEFRVGACPRVIDEVDPGPTRGEGDTRAPRVEAEDGVRVGFACPGQEGHGGDGT